MTNPAHTYTNYRRASGHLASARVLIRTAMKSMEKTSNTEVLREFRIVLESMEDAKFELGQAMDELRSQREANLE